MTDLFRSSLKCSANLLRQKDILMCALQACNDVSARIIFKLPYFINTKVFAYLFRATMTELMLQND